MKKKDKVKGGIRIVVGLLLTVCMIFAGALLGGGTAQAAPAIDFSGTTKGSITIHKYEYNGTGGSPGTGQSTDTVPGDATPLGEVEFTIYQVKDAEELKAIYQGIPAGTMPELSTYWDSTNNELTDAGKALTEIDAKETGSNGEVKFDGLPVGIYLVVETKSPEKVTSQEVFLVSIPTTVDSNNWLYDVHVFPKNATTYGKKVELTKEDSDGNPLGDVTFVLQRKGVGEDGKDTWENVTATGKGTEITLKTGTDGKITISDLPPGNYRLIETNIGDKNTGYIVDYSKTYEFVVSSNGNIEKKNGSGDYITVNGDGSAEISVINYKPDVDKKVKDKNGNWVQEADYSVGDTITYQIAIKVPENIADLERFEVKDKPSNGIKYTTNSLKLYEAKADGTMDATKEITAGYTKTEGTPEGGFTVTFTPNAISGYAGKTIYITYDAVLQSGAPSATEAVKAGNTNTVELVFSKYIKPKDPDDDYPKPPTDDPDDTIRDTTVVYTFQLDIEKKGKTDTGETPLQGVTFDLYRAATANEIADTDITTVTGDDAKAVGLDKDQHWIKVTSLTTGTDGKDSAEGLANGTYYLVETATNTGYNLLSKPVEVVLTTDYQTDFGETRTDDTKKIIIKHEVNADETKIDQTITANGSEVTTLLVTILNTQGFTLPTTGGAGGFLFAVVGCVVMIVGIILFKGTKKKPESE